MLVALHYLGLHQLHRGFYRGLERRLRVSTAKKRPQTSVTRTAIEEGAAHRKEGFGAC